jgi:hypothetical protein
MATVPAGPLKDALQEGLRVGQERRTGIIKALTDAKAPFTKEELEAKPTSELEKLATLAGTKLTANMDFSLMGGPRQETTKTETAAPKPSFITAEQIKTAQARK